MREKFTTTLSTDHKWRLSILSAKNKMDRNEWIENKIDEEWGKYLNEMGNERDRTTETK